MANALERLDEDLRRELERLRAAGLARSLRLPAGIDFASNDYLGFAGDRALAAEIARRVSELAERGELAAPSSRLLRGETERHRQLEARLAAWKGTEAALVLPSGYQANAALLTTLLGPADRAVSDERNHASIIDALRAAGCRRVIVPHLDATAVERELAQAHPSGRTVLVTESLFSMDGDLAPLGVYAELCDRYGALLVVDEAHASGLYGTARGSGLVEQHGLERRVAATMSTFGKALALQGACIAGSRELIETLVNRARAFVFSTALSPLLVAAVDAALTHSIATPERRDRLATLSRRLRAGLFGAGVEVPDADSPIVPVIVGGNDDALAVAARIHADGFDVRAIRPPTVAPGSSRLRLSVHADHSESTIDRLAASVAAALEHRRAVELARR